MAYVLLYNQIEYELTDGDASRLEHLYSSGKPFGPQLFSFGPGGMRGGGTAIIAIGTGIPLTLHTGDD